jgi:beta-1,4-mannosyl-glycoprotein beta-1,4-N-acetylglucosaminyltransferase
VKVFDCFPFFNELDVLEIRLHELQNVVDTFVIVESSETYGGARKPLFLRQALNAGRFSDFAARIVPITIDRLYPPCTDRVTGREREADQRNRILPVLEALAAPDDAIIFSDCDEIPRATAVHEALPLLSSGPWRFQQRSFYYTVNRLVDYGHDLASRPRIGKFRDVKACGSMYRFRMFLKNTCPSITDGGWHFGYFGNGIESIKNKVAALSPFLAEYKLFGDQQLVRDIVNGKDLHHRRCELPETFSYCASDDPSLPAYFLANREKFAHFTEEFYREQYKGLL